MAIDVRLLDRIVANWAVHHDVTPSMEQGCPLKIVIGT